VLVASAHEGEGRSSTAANLAIALAMAGRSVILVDADLRRPSLHRFFDLGDDRGLTGLMSGEVSLPDAMQKGPIPRLRVLAAGPGADKSTDLLEGPRLGRVIRALRKQCDVIVLDSAAVLSVSDAIALATQSDHVLLVGDYRRSTRAGVARALAELGEVVDDNVSGVLVNAPKSAGGLVPRQRDGVAGTIPAGAPPEVSGIISRLDVGDERHAPAFGSASVPGPLPAKAAGSASTVYSSSAAPPVIVPGNRVHHSAGGPVKARVNGTENGASVPNPRGGDNDRSPAPQG